jgi:hypothetical protein
VQGAVLQGVLVIVGVAVQGKPRESTQGVAVSVGVFVEVLVGVSVGWQPTVPGWQVGVGVAVHGSPSESTHGVAVLVNV